MILHFNVTVGSPLHVWFQHRQVPCVHTSAGSTETTLLIIAALQVLHCNLLIDSNAGLFGDLYDTGMRVRYREDLGGVDQKKKIKKIEEPSHGRSACSHD